MKKTFHLDPKLLRDAKEACGAKTATEAIRRGLEALIFDAATERMIAYREPEAVDVPMRREEPAKRKRRVA